MSNESIKQKPVFLRLRRLTTLLEQRNNINDPLGQADLLDAALATCVEFLEGVANVLFSNAPQLNESLKNDGLERLKVIEKFDLLHVLRTAKSMDLGHHTIAGIRKLIQNRVELSHPKPISSNLVYIDHGDSIKFTPKKSLFRSSEEDIKLIKNIFCFLDIYLIDWCQVARDAIFQLLLADELYFSDGKIGLLRPADLDIIKAKLQNLMAIEIKFLNFSEISTRG